MDNLSENIIAIINFLKNNKNVFYNIFYMYGKLKIPWDETFILQFQMNDNPNIFEFDGTTYRVKLKDDFYKKLLRQEKLNKINE